MDDESLSTGEIRRWLERVEQKISLVTGDHEQRLRKLERFMYISVGVATLIGTALGSLIGYLQ